MGQLFRLYSIIVSDIDGHIYNKPLILHSQTISVLEDLFSDDARQRFNDWYYKPHKMYIGGGLLEQMSVVEVDF